MRIITTTLLTAVVLMLGAPGLAQTQSGPTVVQHGMFGTRVLGNSLQPKPTPFSNGLLVSPGGKFLGIRSNWGRTPLPTEVILPPLTDLRDIPSAVESATSSARVAAEPQSVAPEPYVAPTPVSATPQMPTVPETSPASPTPQPATVEPVPTNTQELPMRRMGGVGAGADTTTSAQAPTTPLPVGPRALSPFQTPGGTYTKFEPGFSPAAPPDNRVGRQLTSQLSNSRRIQSLSPIQVQVVGETAVLRGTVASSYDRMVAEQAVRMEAGIWKVDNQLKVAAPATSSNR